ncbi:MAG TPA: TonB-dependent receptor [Burkholderiaceae bacterium]|nr:TonB-dependent receptor [Burkholderiaceae bacterium]
MLFAASFAAAQEPPAASKPEPQPAQRVEITGGRADDTEQRRQSTAAKIVIGREEIERFGDSTLGEVLRRLPGVTLQGPPGRGGAIRMRGLGAGYTQILLDGQRVPPGFSLDSLNPEQIERIEILRAPTAETGARAIAGTINIVTREGFKKRLNDLRVGAGFEHGRVMPGGSWTRNDVIGPLVYNFSLSAAHLDRDNLSVTTTSDEDSATGTPTLLQREAAQRRERSNSLHLSSRLEWRRGEGELLMLSPFLVHSRSSGRRSAQLEQLLGADPAPYDHALTNSDSSFTLARLNGQWRQRLADGTRVEANAGLGLARGASHNARVEYAMDDAPLRSIDDRSRSRERTLSTSAKLSKLLNGDHSLVSGAELDVARRDESGESAGEDTGGDLQATSQRVAAYAQDEWNLSPHWAAHAGLRWEGIVTRGEGVGEAPQRNRSSVWTPLLHAVWKPDPKGRDQVRISLTRSYRSPSLQNLIARPQISLRHPVPDPNTPTTADRAGNPALRPELATGIDIAVERYLSGGGVLSANVFQRRIRDLMRTLTTLETVPWSATPRWVARPQNIGAATTRGIELEAKFRLSEVIEQAPALDLRANASFFRSRVDSVPGPDNRLDQQPGATANLGADYRLRGTPLTVGGNLNWTPGYDTRLSETQSASQGRKRVFDAYALWVIQPGMQLRLSASNLGPEDYFTASALDDGVLRERAQTVTRSFVNWQLRLELKL